MLVRFDYRFAVGEHQISAVESNIHAVDLSMLLDREDVGGEQMASPLSPLPRTD